MIVTVTPNPAYDVTYRIRTGLTPGVVHRVGEVRRRVGGKGVNVARVLGALGEPVRALTWADVAFGAAAAAEGLVVEVVPGPSPVRTTLVIHDADDTTTSLWERGQPVTTEQASGLVEHVARATVAAGPPAALVVSGSLPPGAPTDLLSRLAASARGLDVPVVVDTSGPALAAAARAPGVVITPNTDELTELTGEAVRTADVVPQMTRTLCGPGRLAAVAATLGPEGIVVTTGDAAWHARLDRPLDGNPTGAGDAAVAALAAGLARGHSWPEIAAAAVACASAAVLAPVAGEVDPHVRDDLATRVRVRPLGDHEGVR